MNGKDTSKSLQTTCMFFLYTFLHFSLLKNLIVYYSREDNIFQNEDDKKNDGFFENGYVDILQKINYFICCFMEIGLIYDNILIGVGGILNIFLGKLVDSKKDDDYGEENSNNDNTKTKKNPNITLFLRILKSLNRFRFLIHGFLPLILITNTVLLVKDKPETTIYQIIDNNEYYLTYIILITSIILSIHGFLFNLKIDLVFTVKNGTLVCTSNDKKAIFLNNVLIAILVTIITIMISLYPFNRYLFLSAGSMFFISGIPGYYGYVSSNFGEFIYMNSLILYTLIL
eukprot:TRINITY_DN1077_c0_g1_i1.p1 TRINITY_DN1077_c0_g1~~TRINITY_DN1077_c0_g1_i1.p1  ORF type:complete len:286 (+),score=24.92 TRINITY_DN1077_c0_g1_i1:278-1135(+)